MSFNGPASSVIDPSRSAICGSVDGVYLSPEFMGGADGEVGRPAALLFSVLCLVSSVGKTALSIRYVSWFCLMLLAALGVRLAPRSTSLEDFPLGTCSSAKASRAPLRIKTTSAPSSLDGATALLKHSLESDMQGQIIMYKICIREESVNCSAI